MIKGFCSTLLCACSLTTANIWTQEALYVWNNAGVESTLCEVTVRQRETSSSHLLSLGLSPLIKMFPAFGSLISHPNVVLTTAVSLISFSGIIDRVIPPAAVHIYAHCPCIFCIVYKS